MRNLIQYREQQNLTQEELAERSGLSVRTIQRIEAGTLPKGYTLKVLAKALGIDAAELAPKAENLKDRNLETEPEGQSTETRGQATSDIRLLKLINLSSLPFTFLPPLNIIVPLLIVFYKKKKDPVVKQMISIQILWTILAVFIFLLGVFIRKWFSLDNNIHTIIMLGLTGCNVLVILRNAIGLDKTGALHWKLNFNLL
jgi:transcriptional regulator with XRE-family HTH domain